MRSGLRARVSVRAFVLCWFCLLGFAVFLGEVFFDTDERRHVLIGDLGLSKKLENTFTNVHNTACL